MFPWKRREANASSVDAIEPEPRKLFLYKCVRRDQIVLRIDEQDWCPDSWIAKVILPCNTCELILRQLLRYIEASGRLTG